MPILLWRRIGQKVYVKKYLRMLEIVRNILIFNPVWNVRRVPFWILKDNAKNIYDRKLISVWFIKMKKHVYFVMRDIIYRFKIKFAWEMVIFLIVSNIFKDKMIKLSVLNVKILITSKITFVKVGKNF